MQIKSWDSSLGWQWLFYLARTHPGVAIHLVVGAKAGLLLFPGALNPLANRSGALFRSGARDIAVFDGGDFDVQIDAI